MARRDHGRISEMRIEVGRALITLGQVRRRRGERRAAREALERAHALFRELGAPLWAERAAEELRRIPIRRAAAKDELTPTEEQVARLAAAGRTNREVAQALHMSPKTVEANPGAHLRQTRHPLARRARRAHARAPRNGPSGQKIGNHPMRGCMLAL